MTPKKSQARDLELVRALTLVPGRLAIIRRIGTFPDGAYLSDIMAGVDIPIGSMRSHLKPLEELGAIVGDIPLSKRQGRSVRYTLNVKRISEAFENTRKLFIE